MRNLLNSVEFVKVENAAVAGTSTLTSDAIDMAGWDGVVFLADLGDVTSGSVLGLTAEHSDNDSTGFDDLEGPLAFTAGASDADNKMLILEVTRPEKRYVRAVLTRGSANAVVSSIIAMKYRSLHAPVTQGSTVLDSAILANPQAA